MKRRQALASITAGIAATAFGCDNSTRGTAAAQSSSNTLKKSNGDIDWTAVRNLFPLATDRIHLASFLFVSHPRPVADAIAFFRGKLDADPLWLEAAAFSDSEGRPFAAVKRALAEYAGGKPEEICLTSNTTTGIAMFWHGLRIRPDQTILTTEHEHYVQHESIRIAAERSGAAVRRIALHDRPESANVSEIVTRIERAITPKTRAIGITWVYSSTGIKLPIPEIVAVVARANSGRAEPDRCILMVDGVHGFGNQDTNIAQLGADFVATGTHKWLFAPRGTGFLWGRSDMWPALRPTIPTFDPDAPEPWGAWMDGTPLPPTRASFVSPGGFLAFEHLLAIPAAVELHKQIGRDRIATRIRELNGMFRENVAKIPKVTLHTPQDPALSAGISCFEVAGLKAEEVTAKLHEKKIGTNNSPYKVSYARVAVGIMNNETEVERVLREIAAL
jgi:isopenicillin-N epimerase